MFQLNTFHKLGTLVAGLVLSFSLTATEESSRPPKSDDCCRDLCLTGTWVGTQVCPGVGDGKCVARINEFSDWSGEGSKIYIKQDGEKLFAYMEFFESSYNGLFPSGLNVSELREFSLVSCGCNCTCIGTNTFFEVLRGTLDEDGDHFYAISTVTGHEDQANHAGTLDGNVGNYVQNCTYLYKRVSKNIPDSLKKCPCGLIPNDSVCPCDDTAAKK